MATVGVTVMKLLDYCVMFLYMLLTGATVGVSVIKKLDYCVVATVSVTVMKKLAYCVMATVGIIVMKKLDYCVMFIYVLLTGTADVQQVGFFFNVIKKKS